MPTTRAEFAARAEQASNAVKDAAQLSDAERRFVEDQETNITEALTFPHSMLGPAQRIVGLHVLALRAAAAALEANLPNLVGQEKGAQHA